MSQEVDQEKLALFAAEFGVSQELMFQFVDFVLTSANTPENTSEPENNRDATVEALSSDPYVYVDCAGVFKPGGYKHVEPKGVKPTYQPGNHTPEAHIKGFGSAYQTAEQYGLIDTSHTGDEFKSPVLHISDNGHSMWFLVFNDRTHDQRGSVFTTFTMWLKPELAEQYDPLITEDPTILIDLFRDKYPECDQSNGQLEIISKPLHLEPAGKLRDKLVPVST